VALDRPSLNRTMRSCPVMSREGRCSPRPGGRVPGWSPGSFPSSVSCLLNRAAQSTCRR
jgi:hypothetical protein